MAEYPRNSGRPSNSGRDSSDIPMPQRIKDNKNNSGKFVVEIDESILDYDDSNSAGVKKDSTVYFSNHDKRQAHPTYVSRKSNTRIPETTVAASKAQASAQSKKKPGSKRKKRGTGGAFGFMIFIVITVTIASFIGISSLNDILAINVNSDVVTVTIPENSTSDDMIDILSSNKLIKRKQVCKIFAKFRKSDKKKYLSGIYYLNREMGLEGMLLEMRESQSTAETIQLSFPEGWTVSQMFEKLEKNGVSNTVKLLNSLQNVNYEYGFIKKIDFTEQRYLKLEGYLFPDTYDFYVDSDANYIIRKFLSNFDDKWTDEMQQKADKLGYSMDEIITIASIIQKEAADSTQMPVISSVIHNRLKNSLSYPTLGCDCTLNYVKTYVEPITGEVKASVYKQYYDTSAVKGLPPGPICNPGMDAIEAALNPSDTSYYYFLHDKSGKIYLAKTLNEHDNNYVKAVQSNNSAD